MCEGEIAALAHVPIVCSLKQHLSCVLHHCIALLQLHTKGMVSSAGSRHRGCVSVQMAVDLVALLLLSFCIPPSVEHMKGSIVS